MFEDLTSIPPENRWREQNYPVPVVVSIIRRESSEAEHGWDDGAYLLIKRNSEPYSGRWALVGGKWDFGETLAAAAEREVEEETGLEATYVALRGLVSERLAPEGQSDDKAAHFLIFVCQVDAPNGVAREQAEGAIRWFRRPEIEELHTAGTIIPSDYAMLSRFVTSAPLPYYEAEMLAAVKKENRVAQLLRFEQIR
jgi:8-oxo-dGTP pyrophosphatase MutT (NUDIX family)